MTTPYAPDWLAARQPSEPLATDCQSILRNLATALESGAPVRPVPPTIDGDRSLTVAVAGPYVDRVQFRMRTERDLTDIRSCERFVPIWVDDIAPSTWDTTHPEWASTERTAVSERLSAYISEAIAMRRPADNPDVVSRAAIRIAEGFEATQQTAEILLNAMSQDAVEVLEPDDGNPTILLVRLIDTPELWAQVHLDPAADALVESGAGMSLLEDELEGNTPAQLLLEFARAHERGQVSTVRDTIPEGLLFDDLVDGMGLEGFDA